MAITINDIKDTLKDVFTGIETMYYDEVWEEYDKGYKFVIFLHKFYHGDNGFLYTKFIFYVDKDKNNLNKNHFKYLYDINCSYTLVSFGDNMDLKNKITKIFDDDDFGGDLKYLSELVKTPSTLINEWLSNNRVTDISVYDFKYNPKTRVIGCKSISFNFEMKVNNIEIGLNIKKEEKDNYLLVFGIFDENISIKKSKLENLIQTIGEVIKEKIKEKGE